MEMQDPNLLICMHRKASSSPAVDRFPITEISECDYMSPSWHVSVQGDHMNGFSKQTNKTQKATKLKTNPFAVLLSFRSHRMLCHQICSTCCSSAGKSPPALICSVKAKGQIAVPLSLTPVKDGALHWP